MKKFLLILGASVLLVGCGSTVNLDDVPVVDKAGTAVIGANSGAAGAAGAGGGSGVNAGGVASVDVGGDSSKMPVPSGPKVVYFDHDSFVIRPEFQVIVETQAAAIKANKDLRVVIEGHTDETGGREYNLALGQKRAEAVRSALGLLGVPDRQLEAVSFGKEKPAVPGYDQESMSRNRRAEITYR